MHPLRMLILLVFSILATDSAWAQATFMGIPAPPGITEIEPLSITSNGVTIVGHNSLGAFKWNATGGMVQLGAPSGLTSAAANDVSDDGNTIVGVALDPNAFDQYVPFRWTPGTGSVRIHPSELGAGNTVSADGSIIGGQVYFGTGDEAYRWTAGSGLQGLGQLSGGSDSIFHQVTPDGSVFVGSAIDSGSNSVAIRWDATNEFSVIPGNGGVVPEEATGVSNDAQVIVGAAATASSQFIEAFRWTSTNGTAGLGFLGGLAGSRESAALDVSADGNTVVGYSSAGAGIGVFEAFIWNPSAGLRSLESELNARGAAIPAGWTLQSAVGVSADGNTIIGGGFNPSGNFQGWVATLPEPSISLALGLGVLLLSSLAPNRK